MVQVKFKSREEIWNAIVEKISDIDYPTKYPVTNHAYIMFQYYSQMESGGHEDVLNWLFNEKKIDHPLAVLINSINEAQAKSYTAYLEVKGQEMWELFQLLKRGEEQEEAFSLMVQQADEAYWNINTFQQIVEKYFYLHCEELLQ